MFIRNTRALISINSHPSGPCLGQGIIERTILLFNEVMTITIILIYSHIHSYFDIQAPRWPREEAMAALLKHHALILMLPLKNYYSVMYA